MGPKRRVLLLITDREPFGSGSELLGERFGVNMSLCITEDAANQSGSGLVFSREKHLVGDHAILRGRNASEQINRVLTFNGQSLKGPPGSAALLKFSDTAKESVRNPKETLAARRREISAAGPKEISAAGLCQGIALKDGRGRVVVMGDAEEVSGGRFMEPTRRGKRG